MKPAPFRYRSYVGVALLALAAAFLPRPAAAADTTPPTASIVPLSPASAGGVVQVRMNASDDVAVTSVSLLLDGVSIGTDTGSPYFINWNTNTASNGTHTLTARAVDSSGNPGTSAPVQVTVQNPAFSNEVVVPGITSATTMVFLPDGRMLVGELIEKIWVVHPGSSTPEAAPFLQLDGSALQGEQGLMDIALDPNFATNGWYYVFYTKASATQGRFDRVSRFTASGDGTVAGSELMLWQDPVTSENEHHGGAVFFGPNGKLFITTGDHFNPGDSQRLDSYRGKILRINPDGSVPTDNPFFDGAGPNRDAIWAYGLRNPFRASYDVVSGRIFVGDVGGNDPSTAMEEINIGVAGANYGWPFCEGNCAGYTMPVYTYPHLGRDASVMGGFVYHGGNFTSQYEGSYFFADYVQNWIKRLTFDASGNLLSAVDFEPPNNTKDGPYGDPVKLVQGPDGALYYVDIGFNDAHVPNEAAIRRIRHLTNNQPPVVMASGNPTTGPSPLNVAFSSAGSFDPEGVPLTYSWDFGDNTSSTAANPSHSYATGMYTARLQVSDGSSTALSSGILITVGTPPTAEILTPANGSLFQAGDVIQYSGRGFNSAGSPLPASAFSWTILFHHDSHIHPGGGPFTNITSGTFNIPITGHDFEGTTSYEFILTVTDSSGLATSTSITIFPDKVNLSFSTQPSGLSVDIDGIRKVTPFVLDAVKAFHYTINAPAQVFGGQSYDFVSWSDGGARSHEIVVPTGNISWVATFGPPTGPVGLKGAYAFNEGLGTTTADKSGFNNTGTLVGATWTTQGKFGGALQFNGTSARVNVPDSPSLDLTTAMTLEAWVNPTTVNAQWRDVIMKGTDNYYLDATSLPNGRPALGSSFTTPLFGPSSLSPNVWSHLAATYDGATMRLYVNGVQVTSRAQTGTIPTSSGALSFGGDVAFGQYFAGRIDEIRIYDRAMSAAEIQTDMTIPVVTPVDIPGASPPGASALVGAMPNPFHPSTKIRVRLSSADGARLRVFDVAGRLVRDFGLQQFSAGEHDVVWTGTDRAGKRVAAGVYIARLDAADGPHSLRIILVR